MKYVNYLIGVVVTVTMVGCSTVFRPWNLSQIQEGMSRQDVIQILGEPDYVRTEDSSEILHYSYVEGYNAPLYDDSMHADTPTIRTHEMRTIQRSFSEFHYEVELVEGRVLSYKEIVRND